MPNGSISPDDSDDSDSALEAAAEDLCHALDRQDYPAIAKALKAAFQIMDAQPHEEGPHLDEEEE